MQVSGKEGGRAHSAGEAREERDAPVAVVVHKAVRRERIRPYRRSVPVSRETSSHSPAGSRRAFAEARNSAAWQGRTCTHTYVYTYAYARA